MPVTSWPIVGHAEMVLPGCRDGSELPEPALLARSRSGAKCRRNILLGTGAGAAETMSHAAGCSLQWPRLCGQPGDDVCKKKQKKTQGVRHHNSATGCSSCDRNETGTELHGESDAAASTWRRYSFYENYSDVSRRLSGTVGMYPVSCAADPHSIP